MSVEQVDRIDCISTDSVSGEVVLTISDHLPWGDHEHLHLLQDKLNTYLAFIESDELLQKYPGADGRQVVIEVVGQYPLDGCAAGFFDKARAVIQGAGFDLRFGMLGSTRSRGDVS